MKNKKTSGISLVALVVTIIVLIILTGAVIVTFMKGGIVDRAKEAVFKSDMRTYQEQLVILKSQDQIEYAIEKEPEIKVLEQTLTGEAIKAVLPDFNVDKYGDIVQVVNGELVLVSEDAGTALEQEWLAELGIVVAEEGGETVITFRKTSEGELAVGSEVTASNGEVFYVIGFSGNTTNMLSKYNLKADGSSQDTTGASNPSVFCSMDTWNEASTTSGDNYNDKQSMQSDTTSAVYKAKMYGESLGVIGRLMLRDEALALYTANSTILYGKYETGNYLKYWLGNANAADFACYVDGEMMDISWRWLHY